MKRIKCWISSCCIPRIVGLITLSRILGTLGIEDGITHEMCVSNEKNTHSSMCQTHLFYIEIQEAYSESICYSS
ncbi:uncharacterized protein F4812DRAFT_444592 [Daldinia caldariorum]|uniref:uncharacterized protein n=1 Tax=Daldinia caldariorum TaxID=326644 RepID=UPI002008A342|nr:uncharacterized protein F4812DRAFT_444592 [Daldinia caldariorum]KAI1464097.1 hypothetical protein F4812DRAFT_444592 [Daldinia caldariorum]